MWLGRTLATLEILHAREGGGGFLLVTMSNKRGTEEQWRGTPGRPPLGLMPSHPSLGFAMVAVWFSKVNFNPRMRGQQHSQAWMGSFGQRACVLLLSDFSVGHAHTFALVFQTGPSPCI